MHAKGGGKLLCMHVTVAVVFSAPRKSSSFHSPLFFLLCGAPDYDRSPASSPPLTYPSCFSARNAAAACALCNCQTQEGGKIIMQFSCQKPRIGLRNDGPLFCSHACQSQWKEGGKQKSLLVRLSRNKAPNLPRRKRRRKSYRYKLWWKRGKIFFRRFLGNRAECSSERVGG